MISRVVLEVHGILLLKLLNVKGWRVDIILIAPKEKKQTTLCCSLNSYIFQTLF